MEQNKYFQGLVDNDESLTEDLDDTVAVLVLTFARTIATMIDYKTLDRTVKESQYVVCMMCIREISITISLMNQDNALSSIKTVQELLSCCRTIAVS